MVNWSKNKLYVLVINYNYAKIFNENIDYYEQLNLPVYFIDDQSNKFLSLLDDIKNRFDLTVTDYKKSNFNAINQLNAISFGINKIKDKLSDNDYVWIIDADDVPLLTPNISNQIEDILLYKHLSEDNTYSPSFNGLWFRNAPTSSLIIRVGYIFKHYDKIFSSKIGKDVWFDIRVGCFDPKYVKRDKILMKKVIHGENDSHRYKTII